MFKQILLLVLIVVVVKSQNKNTTLHTDDYINVNRRQYESNIRSYDSQMESFKVNQEAKVHTINTQYDMLEDLLKQNDERLNPLEMLSEFTKNCVTKYRSLIPTISSVKTSISSCITTAINQINSLLNSCRSTRNILQSYYTNTFEKEILNCDKKYGNSTLNYTMCVTSVTSTTNIYTINNQNTFATQLDSAECAAHANLKRALACAFAVQNRTISAISEANALINRCIQGSDNCNRCDKEYTCDDAFFIRKTQVNNRNLTMSNPFYGRNQTSDCLMLKLY